MDESIFYQFLPLSCCPRKPSVVVDVADVVAVEPAVY